MDRSFVEYRDKTEVESDSSDEVIDNSVVADQSFSFLKKTPGKNKTVFVAESEESSTDDEFEEDKQQNEKAIHKRSNILDTHIISSGDGDPSIQDNLRRQSKMSFNSVAVSSSDEDQWSPEMVPKRRPQPTPSNGSNKTPFTGRKVKKRMILDSDTDNSILIEHESNRKMTCMKDTPLKISGKENNINTNNIISDSDNDKKSAESDDNGSERAEEFNDRCEGSGDAPEKDDDRSDNDDDISDNGDDRSDNDDHRSEERDSSSVDESNHDDHETDTSEGPDEDQMVMSRTTRMSIMGFVPKENDSDDSDFIQSDESNLKSIGSSFNTASSNSISELPDAGISVHKSPEKNIEPNHGGNSLITCSPFSSPEKEIDQPAEVEKPKNEKSLSSRILKNLKAIDVKSENEDVITIDDDLITHDGRLEVEVDEDVAIIDSNPEIIALSSDDDYELKINEKSPKQKKLPSGKSPKNGETSTSQKRRDDTNNQNLVPPSYPNPIKYVKRQEKEIEMRKVEELQMEVHNVQVLLKTIDVHTLPDGGQSIIKRLNKLKEELRRHMDEVATMVVQPDEETNIEDGNVEKGLSWDDIQMSSNRVQPRMFGRQAMATHMAERNHILDRLRDLHASLASRPPESKLGSSPPGLTSTLMPHQLHALAWLRWRETQRPAGGILADDMGLGKTITMISLVLGDPSDHDSDNDEEEDGNRSKLVNGGTLVVCPASLLQQWAGEVTRHCASGRLLVCQHHGAARADHPRRLVHHHLVLTTYNLLQRDSEKNGVLMRVKWRRIILDEAHIVRNHKSATSVAVSALRGKRRWCLTGTPVHNKDLDLFALLKFLKCTPFDDLTMWKKWIDNKSSGGQERMSTIMRCILLRRTKQQLQQKGQLGCLPKRAAHEKNVTLSKEEMNVYQKVLVFSKTLFAQFLHQRAEKQADVEGLLAAGKDGAYAKMHKKMIALQGAKPVKSHEILVLLLRLRQVCCHCGLIAAMLDGDNSGPVEEDQGSKDLLAELKKMSLEESRSNRKSDGKRDKDDGSEDEIAEKGTTAAEAIRSVLSLKNPVFRLERLSSKIQAVMHCLHHDVLNNKGDKAVVVSQWTSVLRLVEKELDKARIRSVTLNGSVPVPARAPLIDALNDPQSDVQVMLLSLCAGGVGLNLCGANHLLLLDPHWNPQLEEQAQDRIYRVGQNKPVNIYRFMCVDTVEQTIRKLQQAKLELAENVLTGARNTNASKLTIEDLKMLFNMGQT